MFNFLKDLTSELTAYPLEQKLELENFCFHVGKLHHELVRMPEQNAAAILGHFGSLRELLDFYSAAQELRPVLPAEPVQAALVQLVQDAVKLRSASVWRQPDDKENLAQLPDGPSVLVFNLEEEQEKSAFKSLLLKRVAARRVPAFCFSVDYEKPDKRFSQGYERIRESGEVWRCLPNTLQFSTARVVAEYRLMGAAPAMRACQVFAAEYLEPMGALMRVHMEV